MFNIRVERLVKANIDKVFERLSDHENYKMFRGIEDSRLIEFGQEEKNGSGALREIKAGIGTLHERIVEYKAPTKLAYLIEYSKPLPYKHELGVITLSQHPEGCMVVWQSRGHINIPIIGSLYFDKQIENKGGRAFASILKQIEVSLNEDKQVNH